VRPIDTVNTSCSTKACYTVQRMREDWVPDDEIWRCVCLGRTLNRKFFIVPAGVALQSLSMPPAAEARFSPSQLKCHNFFAGRSTIGDTRVSQLTAVHFVPFRFSYRYPYFALCRGYTWNKIISRAFQPSSTSDWNNFT